MTEKKKEIPIDDLENAAKLDDPGEVESPDLIEAEDLRGQLVAMEDKWKRALADHSNYKKRIEEEQRSFRKYACYDFANDILRVLDNFESSFSFMKNLPEEARNIVIGVEYIMKELSQILSAHGVSPIEVRVGDRYDSSLMEAVDSQVQDEAEAGTVLAVQRRGWRIHDRMLRAVQVVVAATAEDEDEKGGEDSKTDEE